MKKSNLTPAEQETLRSYASIAAQRQASREPDFWMATAVAFTKILPPPAQIIDLGCGSGEDVRLLKKIGYATVGVDISRDMLLLANQSVPTADLLRMNLYDLALADDSFDGFWSVTSLLHLPKKRLPLALAEIRRITKPGGIGVIIVKEGDGERMVPGKFAGDCRFFALYRLDELESALNLNGLTTIAISREVRPQNPETVFLQAVVRVNK